MEVQIVIKKKTCLPIYVGRKPKGKVNLKA